MAVDIDLIADNYKKLLIAQYYDKPKASETIKSICKIFLADGVYWEVLNGFNIETAVGAQLDTIGKYVGVDRFFEGSSIDDEAYRVILKLKIIKNNTNNSVVEIVNSLQELFGNDIIFVDNYDMSINYYVDMNIIDIAEIAKQKDCFPRPVGVGMGILEVKDYFALADYNSANVDNAFGFGYYENDAVEGGSFLNY